MRRSQRRSPLHAVVIAGLLLGTIAVRTAVHGSDGTTTACRDAAPWIIAEPPGPHAERTLSALAPDAPPLDVVTFNLHSGLGPRLAFFRRRAEVERNLRDIARSIATAAPDARGPDVVGLNEVDFGSRRSGWLDQARFMADELEAITGTAYRVISGETWRRDVPGMEVRFGNAVLVRLPVVDASACLFDHLDRCRLGGPASSPPRRGLLSRLLREPRGVIRVTVDLHGQLVDVLVTHLDAFVMAEREAQAALLVSRFVVGDRTTVLLGDMNAVPAALTRKRRLFAQDRTHAILATGSLADACISLASRRGEKSLTAWATYPAGAPVWGLDWVLGSPDLSPEDVTAIGDRSSDHRGLYVRYRSLQGGAEIEESRARHERICARLKAFDSACGSAGS